MTYKAGFAQRGWLAGSATAGMIDPAGAWPGDDLDPGAIASAAAELRSVGGKVAQHGATIARHWQGLARSYEAPEAAQLLSSIRPVEKNTDILNSNTARVAAALELFADEADRVKRAIGDVRARATTLRASVTANSDADGQASESSSSAAEDLARAASSELASEVNHWAAVLAAAEQRCAAIIAACADRGQVNRPKSSSVALAMTSTPVFTKNHPWGPPTDRPEVGWSLLLGVITERAPKSGLVNGWQGALGALELLAGGRSTSRAARASGRSAVDDIPVGGGPGEEGVVPEGGGLEPAGPNGGPKLGPEGQGYRGSDPKWDQEWDQWHRSHGGPWVNGMWAPAEPSGAAQESEGRAFEATQAQAAAAEAVPNGEAQAEEAWALGNETSAALGSTINAEAGHSTNPGLSMERPQLEAKFKHASDFGVAEPRGVGGFDAYSNAVGSFVRDSSTVQVSGTYRGNPAILNYNATSHLVVVQAPDGAFISGWRMTDAQLQMVLSRGSLGGG